MCVWEGGEENNYLKKYRYYEANTDMYTGIYKHEYDHIYEYKLW